MSGLEQQLSTTAEPLRVELRVEVPSIARAAGLFGAPTSHDVWVDVTGGTPDELAELAPTAAASAGALHAAIVRTLENPAPDPVPDERLERLEGVGALVDELLRVQDRLDGLGVPVRDHELERAIADLRVARAAS